MCSWCYNGMDGATEAVITKSRKIARPCHEIRMLAPEFLSESNEESCIFWTCVAWLVDSLNVLLDSSENHRCPPLHFREPCLIGLGKGNSGSAQ